MIEFVANHVIPAAMSLLPERMESLEADLLLLAFAGQESEFRHRRQVGGPARGLWQFELGNQKAGGGLRGVIKHPASAEHLRAVCSALLYDTEADIELHAALEHNDVLACAVARLLIWTDPWLLPAVGDSDAAWELYMRTWRPGKPRFKAWQANYEAAMALAALGGSAHQ